MILRIVLFLRPISLIQVNFQVFGLNLLELFSIVASIFLLLAIAVNIGRIRPGAMGTMAIFFAFYCLMSLFWGSSVKEACRLVLPLLMFFAALALACDRREVKILLLCLAAGYGVLIMANFAKIAFFGGGYVFKVYQSGLNRYGGVTSGVHALVHVMFLFSPVYLLLATQAPVRSKILRAALFVMLLLSFYCIFKTYTRTVYVGSFVFWSVYGLGANRKVMLVLFAGLLLGLTIWQAQVTLLTWDVSGAVENKGKIADAGSGRIGIWRDAMSRFGEAGFERKMLGFGMVFGGAERRPATAKEEGSGGRLALCNLHNDYLGLLFTSGLVGLVLYLALPALWMRDIIGFRGDPGLKWIFAGFLLAALCMNMLSNSYLSRVEAAQLFWFNAGLFQRMRRFPRRGAAGEGGGAALREPPGPERMPAMGFGYRSLKEIASAGEIPGKT